jgi:hypothetical protein
MGLYLVETVSIFRHRYAIEASDVEGAKDTVVMGIGEVIDLPELSQEHIDECISSVREIDEFEYLRIFEEDNDYLRHWPLDQKLKCIKRAEDES